MPMELALLPFVESAFQPEALSRAKAAGLWQFMPATGKDYELEQNLWRDDRRDVLESTRAALDYFEYLHGLFGSLRSQPTTGAKAVCSEPFRAPKEESSRPTMHT